MTISQGGANSSPNFDQTTATEMLKRVRQIVTRSGQRPRGYVPTRKGTRLKFESLIEERALRVFEVASYVTKIVTQPCKFKFKTDIGRIGYTPDCELLAFGNRWYIEVKPNSFTASPEQLNRMRTICKYMEKDNHNFAIILDSDVSAGNLQSQLTELLRKRPPPGRYREDRDPNIWDDTNPSLSHPETVLEWREAQRLCDELLTRVMRRDPDELFEATT